MTERIIHILKHGLALCDLEGVPARWPEGHQWISFKEPEEIKRQCSLACRKCLAEYKELR